MKRLEKIDKFVTRRIPVNAGEAGAESTAPTSRKTKSRRAGGVSASRGSRRQRIDAMIAVATRKGMGALAEEADAALRESFSTEHAARLGHTRQETQRR